MCTQQLPGWITRGQITVIILTALLFCVTANAQTEQAKLTASDAAAGDFFGEAVSISGDTAIVGATLPDPFGNGTGAVWFRVDVFLPPEKLHLSGHLAPPHGGPATSLVQITLESEAPRNP